MWKMDRIRVIAYISFRAMPESLRKRSSGSYLATSSIFSTTCPVTGSPSSTGDDPSFISPPRHAIEKRSNFCGCQFKQGDVADAEPKQGVPRQFREENLPVVKLQGIV